MSLNDERGISLQTKEEKALHLGVSKMTPESNVQKFVVDLVWFPVVRGGGKAFGLASELQRCSYTVVLVPPRHKKRLRVDAVWALDNCPSVLTLAECRVVKQVIDRALADKFPAGMVTNWSSDVIEGHPSPRYALYCRRCETNFHSRSETPGDCPHCGSQFWDTVRNG